MKLKSLVIDNTSHYGIELSVYFSYDSGTQSVGTAMYFPHGASPEVIATRLRSLANHVELLFAKDANAQDLNEVDNET
jgi:hypothetical protein